MFELGDWVRINAEPFELSSGRVIARWLDSDQRTYLVQLDTGGYREFAESELDPCC